MIKKPFENKSLNLWMHQLLAVSRDDELLQGEMK